MKLATIWSGIEYTTTYVTCEGVHTEYFCFDVEDCFRLINNILRVNKALGQVDRNWIRHVSNGDKRVEDTFEEYFLRVLHNG